MRSAAEQALISPVSNALSMPARRYPTMRAAGWPLPLTSVPPVRECLDIPVLSLGVNPNAPPLPFLNSVGRSVYNGLQMKLTGNVERPYAGVHNLNFQVSYALSRFKNAGGTFGSGASSPSASDQDSGPNSLDNANPNRYLGPSVLDRTNQFSFGGYAELPGGFQLAVIGHFWSP